MKNKKVTGSLNPTVNLAINKSRIKKYGKNKEVPLYYLEKGQEFQIELYNPTQDKILAKITLNNKTIDGGLILRPAERVFLERYLDTNNKFLFDTYHVKDNETNEWAIEKNGDVNVEFFREVTPLQNYGNGMFRGNMWNDPYTQHYDLITPFNNYSIGNTNNYDNNTTISFCSNNPSTSLLTSNSIETGTVDKGSFSEQGLEQGSGEFEIISFHSVDYKLLPKSQKKNTVSDHIKRYCGNCGAKCKTKFCPQCGTKQ